MYIYYIFHFIVTCSDTRWPMTFNALNHGFRSALLTLHIWMDQIHLLGMPRLALRSPATQAFVEAYRTQALTHTQFKSMQMTASFHPHTVCCNQSQHRCLIF